MLISFATPFLALANETPKSGVNTFLSDWALPLLGLFMVSGAVHGLIKNADLIQNKNDQGNVLQGFLNVGKILLYYLLIVGVIIGVVSAINGLSGSLRID